RHLAVGPPGLPPRAPVPPRRESRQLWEALRPLLRGGDRRGAVHLRTRGGGPQSPREVRLGGAIFQAQCRAARGLCVRERQRGRRRRAGGFHLKSGGNKSGMPSLRSEERRVGREWRLGGASE